MKIITLLAQLLLLGWFFGCIVTYKIGKRILVDGMGIKSAEFIMFVLYGAGLLLFWLYPAVGQWYLLAVLLFWFVIQFFCHWYYTIFGASETKRKGYNECFRHTIHLIPARESRVIPDLYHILLHLFLLLNIGLLLWNITARG